MSAGELAKPQLLAITSELPWPLNTGGHLRSCHLLRALSGTFRVRLIVPVPAGESEAIGPLSDHGIEVVPAPVAPRSRWKESLCALQSAARREPYVFYRRHDWAAVRRQLRAVTATAPALVYLDHLDPIVYRCCLPTAPLIVDMHNVYSRLARRASAEQSNPLVRFYLRREASLIARAEAGMAREADLVFAVSADEQAHFRQIGASDVRLIPNGVDVGAFSKLPTGRVGQPPVLLYLGAMSWSPNAKAAIFLAESVMPRIREAIPDARLRIVGRNPLPEVCELSRLAGVDVVGTVRDIGPELASASVLAVPLDSGGGTRLKILEAFAAGLPVVSTPIGCEGLDVEHERHLLVASREQFVPAISSLLGDGAHAVRLAAEARDLAERHYDWKHIGESAVKAAWEVCKREHARTPDAPAICQTAHASQI